MVHENMDFKIISFFGNIKNIKNAPPSAIFIYFYISESEIIINPINLYITIKKNKKP